MSNMRGTNDLMFVIRYILSVGEGLVEVESPLGGMVRVWKEKNQEQDVGKMCEKRKKTMKKKDRLGYLIPCNNLYFPIKNNDFIKLYINHTRTSNGLGIQIRFVIHCDYITQIQRPYKYI